MSSSVADRLVEAALHDLEEDEGQHRIADLSRVDAGSGQRAACLELGQARLHRPARDAQSSSDLDEPDARIDRQLLHDSCVDPIETGHTDQ